MLNLNNNNELSDGPRSGKDEFPFGERGRETQQYNIKKSESKAKGDCKPEVFFIGQIAGGVDFETSDGLFCELLPDCGEFWEILEPSGLKTFVTQTTYTEEGQMFIWSHPIDLHFTVNDLNGWPRAVVKIWRLDETNKVDVLSYGVCTLPKTAGFHQIYIETWSPMGNWKFGTLSFFLGNQPQIPSQGTGQDTIPYDIVNNAPNRSKLLGRSSGKVLLEIECIMKNLEILNTTGQENPVEHRFRNRDY